MGEITKNIPKPEEKQENIPESLSIRKQNHIDAGYDYKYDSRELDYIAFNTLRNKRPKDKQILDVIKIYRLKDREDDEKENLVWYQESKVFDFEDNLKDCPIDERLGVEDAPKTNKIKNANDEVTDISLIETQNHFYIPFTVNKVRELLEESRNSQNVVCYIGYAKPFKQASNDFIEEKKMILDQVAFVEKSFDELVDLPMQKNVKTSFKKKDKSNEESQKVENTEEVQPQKENQEKPDNRKLTVEELQEQREEKEKENRSLKINSDF